MRTCASAATRTKLAKPTEYLIVLLLIELMIYVKPCAMEMPALLAALLQDAETMTQQQSHHYHNHNHHHQQQHQQQQQPYEELSDAMLPPLSPQAQAPASAAIQPPVPPIPLRRQSSEAISLNDLFNKERKEMLNEALLMDKQHSMATAPAPASATKNEDNFEDLMPPAIAATAGVPIKEEMSSSSSSSAAASLSLTSALRHCSIEIVKKVSGICQTLPHAIGTACVAGDYMDVFNMECM